MHCTAQGDIFSSYDISYVQHCNHCNATIATFQLPTSSFDVSFAWLICIHIISEAKARRSYILLYILLCNRIHNITYVMYMVKCMWQACGWDSRLMTLWQPNYSHSVVQLGQCGRVWYSMVTIGYHWYSVIQYGTVCDCVVQLGTAWYSGTV